MKSTRPVPIRSPAGAGPGPAQPQPLWAVLLPLVSGFVSVYVFPAGAPVPANGIFGALQSLLPPAVRLLPASPRPWAASGREDPGSGCAGPGQPCRAFPFRRVSTPSSPDLRLLLGCCGDVSPQEVKGGQGVLRLWLTPCSVSLLLRFAAEGRVFEITRGCCLQEKGKKQDREEENPPHLLSRAVPHTLLYPSYSAAVLPARQACAGFWDVIGSCAVPPGESGPKNVHFLPGSMCGLVAH